MANNKCILPWIAVDRNPKSQKGKITFSPCCFFDTSKKYKSVAEYWNSDEIKELRQYFIENKRHPGCNQCWNAEDKGIKSLRQSVTQAGSGSTYRIIPAPMLPVDFRMTT